MTTEILPKPQGLIQIWGETWAKTCPCCNEYIRKGDAYFKLSLWSMSPNGHFGERYIHAQCLPNHPSNAQAVAQCLELLQELLGYAPPQVYIHQYSRPIVIGQRNPDGGKKIVRFAATLVNPRTNGQLVIDLRGQVYSYKPSYKGTEIDYQGHPLFTSSWYPIDKPLAQALWLGEMISS